MSYLDERSGAIAVAVATLMALSTAPANADPIGPACADYAAAGLAGAGSLAGTATQLLTLAASRIPNSAPLAQHCPADSTPP